MVEKDKEVRPGRGELSGISHEEGAERGQVAPLPRIEGLIHGGPGQGDFGVVMSPEAPDAFHPGGAVAERRAFGAMSQDADVLHRLMLARGPRRGDRKSTRLNSSH